MKTYYVSLMIICIPPGRENLLERYIFILKPFNRHIFLAVSQRRLRLSSLCATILRRDINKEKYISFQELFVEI